MFSYFSWNLLPNSQQIVQGSILFVIFLSYMYLVYKDFRYKEMPLYLILGVGSLNIFLLFIPIFLYSCKCLIPLLSMGFLLWLFVIFLNDKFNSEKTVGMADIDIFSLQVILSIVPLVFTYIKHIKGTAFILIATNTIMNHLQFLLFGFGLMIIYWFVITIYNKVKNKEKSFKELLSENKYLPIVLVFVPLVLSNVYVLLGTR